MGHRMLSVITYKKCHRSKNVSKSLKGFNTSGYQQYPSGQSGISNQISLKEFFRFLRHLTLSFIICGILVYGYGWIFTVIYHFGNTVYDISIRENIISMKG